MASDEHVDVTNTVSEEYRKVLERIAMEGECPAPFCKDSDDYHKHEIEWRGKHWKLTRNSFNYQNAEHAFLIVHNEHVSFDGITIDAWVELYQLIQDLRSRFGIRGATFMFRFGEKSHTGASVTHAHAHLIVGHTKTQQSEPIFGVVGFAPKKM